MDVKTISHSAHEIAEIHFSLDIDIGLVYAVNKEFCNQY
jgi:hypothetical protein